MPAFAIVAVNRPQFGTILRRSQDCSFPAFFLPELCKTCMFQAVSELEPVFLGGMGPQATEEHQSFYFCTLHHPGAAFRQHELQFFAENCRVSAILASWRPLERRDSRIGRPQHNPEEHNVRRATRNCPGLETVVLVR